MEEQKSEMQLYIEKEYNCNFKMFKEEYGQFGGSDTGIYESENGRVKIEVDQDWTHPTVIGFSIKLDDGTILDTDELDDDSRWITREPELIYTTKEADELISEYINKEPLSISQKFFNGEAPDYHQTTTIKDGINIPPINDISDKTSRDNSLSTDDIEL